MAIFDVTGIIKEISAVQVISDKFRKISILINESTDPDSDKNLLEAEALNDTVTEIEGIGLRVGDKVSCKAFVGTRLYINKNNGLEGRFTSVKIKSIEKK